MHCSKCGFENPEGMKFCGRCTNPLALICPKCRFENPPGSKFCGQCAPTRFVNCPRCEEPLEAPAPEIQIERLRRFQLSKPAYWQWSPRELRLLMERLKPGDVVSPTFAHSCSIRRPDGRVVEYMRTAVEGVSC
jgi:hypothetical protein